MSDIGAKRQAEIDANYKAFLKLLPNLMEKHAGKFVIMRDKEVVDFFDTARDAIIHATRTYDDGLFSVQEIIQSSTDLGWFSHAPHYAAV
jgi:hypothetical protein